MKRLLLLLVITSFMFAQANSENRNINSISDKSIPSTDENGKSQIIHLDVESFKENIFNYETNKEWTYNGNQPAILDFYADWCGPCKQLSPVLVELQKEYGEKIQIYKINTDKQRELTETFGIRSLPTIVFIPMEGDPQAVMGFRPKNELETMIKELLKVEK